MCLYFSPFNDRLEMDQSGLDAIMELSRGDMRKCLNIMQVCFFVPSFAHVYDICNVCICVHTLLPYMQYCLVYMLILAAYISLLLGGLTCVR